MVYYCVDEKCYAKMPNPSRLCRRAQHCMITKNETVGAVVGAAATNGGKACWNVFGRNRALIPHISVAMYCFYPILLMHG